MTVLMVKKYLAKKLGLESESQVTYYIFPNTSAATLMLTTKKSCVVILCVQTLQSTVKKELWNSNK
jgi:hypothetical protein